MKKIKECKEITEELINSSILEDLIQSGILDAKIDTDGNFSYETTIKGNELADELEN